MIHLKVAKIKINLAGRDPLLKMPMLQLPAISLMTSSNALRAAKNKWLVLSFAQTEDSQGPGQRCKGIAN